jgi:hypothetical protein
MSASTASSQSASTASSQSLSSLSSNSLSSNSSSSSSSDAEGDLASNETLYWYLECSSNNIATFNSTHVAIDGGANGFAFAPNERLVLFVGSAGTSGPIMAVATASGVHEGKLYANSTTAHYV